MKICFAIQDMSLGGSSTVVHDLIKNWPSKTDELFLLIFFNNIDKRYSDLAYIPNLKIIKLYKKKTIDLVFLKRLKIFIDNCNPDIISSHLTCTFYLKIIGAQKIAKIFHTIHSEPSKDLPLIYRLYLIHDIRIKRIKLIGCCRYISEKAKILYKAPCYTINNGIDPLFRSNSLQIKENTVFLYVGRFDPLKRVTTIIDAFGKMKSNNACLKICGYGDDEKNILNSIEKNNNKDRIFYLGKTQEVENIYGGSDVLCLVSEREGMPITLLESIQNGLAIIASNVGGISEYVNNGHNGFLLDSVNIDSVCEKMELLANDKATINIFKNNSLKMAEKINAKNMAKKYYSYFEHLYENKDE